MSSGYRILLVVYEGIMYSLEVNMVIEQLHRFLFHFAMKLRIERTSHILDYEALLKGDR